MSSASAFKTNQLLHIAWSMPYCTKCSLILLRLKCLFMMLYLLCCDFISFRNLKSPVQKQELYALLDQLSRMCYVTK